jgi:hypothetical protein
MADGKVILDTHVRLTNTYRKTKGKWYCVGEHNSFPVDSTTGKGVFGHVSWPQLAALDEGCEHDPVVVAFEQTLDNSI